MKIYNLFTKSFIVIKNIAVGFIRFTLFTTVGMTAAFCFSPVLIFALFYDIGSGQSDTAPSATKVLEFLFAFLAAIKITL